MRVRVIRGNITEVTADLCVVNLFSGVRYPGGATGAMDHTMGGAIRHAIQEETVTGRYLETPLVESGGHRVLVAGLGSSSVFEYDEVEAVAEAVGRACLELNFVKTVASIVHGSGIGGLEPAPAAARLVRGTFSAWRHLPDKQCPTLLIVEYDEKKFESLMEGVLTASEDEERIILEGDGEGMET